ncbi:rRNA-processing protein las1 [Haplosporangium sp. Z 27]|nr:rRNA-processing protein las1 [Haplosporangium sp. Z 27]
MGKVHQWFYPPLTEDGTPDIQAQERALRRIKAWEARGKLPHAIDSTAAFVGAIVRDWTQTCSDQDLRLMYSMVFIRFVNGYVDAFQTSKSAKSIAYLAVEKVGMPIWFVELRHTATHDYLPSLTILRSAAQQALAWINDNYWMQQLVSVKMDETLSVEMISAMSDDVRHMIESFRSEKERQIDDLQGTSSSKDGEPLSFWVSLLNGMLDKLIEANNANQIAALPTATAEQKSDAKIGGYLLTILAWIKELITLHYNQSKTTRARAIASSTTSSNQNSPSSTPRTSFAALASQYVAENTTMNQAAMFDDDSIIDIVQDCLENIRVHFSPLIRSVLNTVIVCDADIKDRISHILKQIDQSAVAASSPSTPTITTITTVATTVITTTTATATAPETSSVGGKWRENSLLGGPQEDTEMTQGEIQEEEDTNMDESQPKKESNVEQASDNTSNQQSSEAWSFYDEDSWRPCPIGCLPGGIIPDLSLPWDLDVPPIARVMI